MLALSLLALLALGCSPVLAQAEDSSGIQYSDAPPTVTGGKAPTGKEPPATSSKTSGGATAPTDSNDSSDSSGGGSSAGGSSNSGGPSDTARDDTGKQGSPGKEGGNGSLGSGKEVGAAPASAQGDEGSSPLVPVLIAIAALAAISLGAVMYRRRRGDSSGSSVSPEAG